MNLVKKLIFDFDTAKSLSDFDSLFKKYDKWFFIVTFLKLQDFGRWRLFWEMLYEWGKYKNFFPFKISKKKLLTEIELFFNSITVGEEIKFAYNNDLSWFFGNKSLLDIDKYCDNIKIHSSKNEQRLTFQTCKDLISFILGGNHCNNIKYNIRMKNLCFDLEKYLYTNFYTLKNFINSEYLDKKFLEKKHKILSKDKGFSLLVLNDFLKKDKILSFLEYKEFLVLERRKNRNMSNKTVFIRGIKAYNLFKFFNSPGFKMYLNLFFGEKVKYGNVIDIDYLVKNKLYKYGGVYQLYSYGDFLDWHTDTYVDLHKFDGREYPEVGSIIYYIGTSEGNDWNLNYGGNLCLSGSIKSNSNIEFHIPRENKLILLRTSPYKYHKVSKIKKQGAWRLTYQNLIIKYDSFINDAGYLYN